MRWPPLIPIFRSLRSLLLSLQLLLSSPNASDALVAEISQEFITNYELFASKARQWTQRYAKGDDASLESPLVPGTNTPAPAPSPAPAPPAPSAPTAPLVLPPPPSRPPAVQPPSSSSSSMPCVVFINTYAPPRATQDNSSASGSF